MFHNLQGPGFLGGKDGRSDDESSLRPGYSLDDLTDVEVPPEGFTWGDLLQAGEDGILRPVQPDVMAEGWISLGDLSDVDTTGATVGSLIQFDGDEFVIVSPSQVGNSISLNDLSDVTITTPSTGQGVIWNGSQFVNGTPNVGAHNLDSHTDCTVSSPVTGQTLRYNGTVFINDTLSSDDIANDSNVNGGSGSVSDALDDLQDQVDELTNNLSDLEDRVTDLEDNGVEVSEPLKQVTGTIDVAASSSKLRGSGFNVGGGTGGTTVTFTPAFSSTPTIIVKLFGDGGTTLTAEAYAESPSASGFTVRIITTSGTNSIGRVDFLAMGTA